MDNLKTIHKSKSDFFGKLNIKNVLEKGKSIVKEGKNYILIN